MRHGLAVTYKILKIKYVSMDDKQECELEK